MRLRELLQFLRSPQQRIADEAARWVVRQHMGTRSETEDAAFRQWLTADPRNRAAFLASHQAWRRADRLKARRPSDGRIDPDLYAPPKLQQFRPTMVVGAGLAAAVVAAVGAWWLYDQATWTSYQTGAGGFTRVQLSDGSVVELNADSRARVRLSGSKRSVELINGEAAFNVTHDDKRPFEVTAAGETVTAVGTAFTVQLSSANAVEVTVSEGRVVVAPAASVRQAPRAATRQLVSAGEIATASRDRVVVRRADSTELARRLAWQEGGRQFEGAKLADVVAEFNRGSPRQVRIGDAALADIRIGARFRTSDQASFLSALEQTFGIRAVERDGEIVLLGASETDSPAIP